MVMVKYKTAVKIHNGINDSLIIPTTKKLKYVEITYKNKIKV